MRKKGRMLSGGYSGYNGYNDGSAGGKKIKKCRKCDGPKPEVYIYRLFGEGYR